MLFNSKGIKRYEKLKPYIAHLGARFPENSKIKHFEILSDGKRQYVFVCSCENKILNQTMGKPICPKEYVIERKMNCQNSPLLYGKIENCIVHVIFDVDTKEVLWAFYDENECLKHFDFLRKCCATSRKLDWRSVNLKYLFQVNMMKAME